MNRFWSLTARDGANVLEIRHEIVGDGWWTEDDPVCAAGIFRAQLGACAGEMNVLINSHGGDTFAAADIYTALREYSASRGRVICYVTGIAASAASLIAMAGDEVRISRVGMMMIHDPWTVAMGNAGELREMADVLDTVRDAVAAAYVSRTGKSAAEIREMMAKERYMTAEEAVEDGFADAIGVYEGSLVAKMQLQPPKEGEIGRLRDMAARLKAQLLGDEDRRRMEERERTAMRLRARCI